MGQGRERRNGWEPDEVATTLRDLFLELQFGPKSQADPTTFAKCLQLDHAVQQVGEEGRHGVQQFGVRCSGLRS